MSKAQEVVRLRKAIDRQRDSQGRARVSGEVRGRAVSYSIRRYKEGASAATIEAEIGIGRLTVSRWITAALGPYALRKKSKRQRSTADTALRRVTVVADAAPRSGGYTIHGRHDVELRDLTLEQVTTILRAL